MAGSLLSFIMDLAALLKTKCELPSRFQHFDHQSFAVLGPFAGMEPLVDADMKLHLRTRKLRWQLRFLLLHKL